MKIVIDARMLYWTGIGRYTKALLDKLQLLDTENEYAVLVRRADWHLWEPRASNFTKIESNINPYSLAEQGSLYLQLRSLKADVVHFTAPNTPLLYQGRRVVTIHDLTLIDFNTSRGSGLTKLLRGLKRLPFRLVLLQDLRGATRLVTGTNYVRQQLIDRFHVKPERVSTALLATDPNLAAPQSLERLGELGSYAFYVGNMYPYKNLSSTIRSLAEPSLVNSGLNLVIAGKRDPFSEELERLAGALGVGSRVKFVGYVTDGEMVALYRGAAVYVNPSLSEGFGLQGLEAMAQGLPVVAARASCLPEVYGDAAVYFNPTDVAQQAHEISTLLSDNAARRELAAAGLERIQTFNWHSMAQKTLAAYIEAVKTPN
jgi:glycosyltransferase involved in cell wall biosynthesis